MQKHLSRRKSLTLQQLWREYGEEHPEGCKYSQYSSHQVHHACQIRDSQLGSNRFNRNICPSSRGTPLDCRHDSVTGPSISTSS